MSSLLARIANSAQHAIAAHAAAHGITATPSMVDEVVISAKRREFCGESERRLYAHIQWRAEKIVLENVERKRIVTKMLASMAGANDCLLVSKQAG